MTTQQGLGVLSLGLLYAQVSEKFLAESELGAKCLSKLLKVLLGITGQNSLHCYIYYEKQTFHSLTACVPLPAFCYEDLIVTLTGSTSPVPQSNPSTQIQLLKEFSSCSSDAFSWS